MIKNNLGVILAERGLKMIDVINATGINKNTVASLVNNKASGIQYDTLEKLCDFLDVTPGEILSRQIFKVEVLGIDVSYEEKFVDFEVNMTINADTYHTNVFISFDEETGSFGIGFEEEISKKLLLLPHEKMTDTVNLIFANYLNEYNKKALDMLNGEME